MTTTARAHEPAPGPAQPRRHIWSDVPSLATANELSARSLIGHLGIEFLELGDDYLIARMPVDDRTRQPLGLLHGGASVALAETLASWAASSRSTIAGRAASGGDQRQPPSARDFGVGHRRRKPDHPRPRDPGLEHQHHPR